MKKKKRKLKKWMVYGLFYLEIIGVYFILSKEVKNERRNLYSC